MDWYLYSESMTPPEWRAFLERLGTHHPHLRGAVLEAIDGHSEGDRVAVRIDALLKGLA